MSRRAELHEALTFTLTRPGTRGTRPCDHFHSGWAQTFSPRRILALADPIFLGIPLTSVDMRTRLSILLGAALCLLGTLTTTHAAGKGGGKPGGGGDGGGGGSTPGGTIYFLGPIEGLGSGSITRSMSPDGSNETVVGSGGTGLLRGNPSLDMYNRHRWFLGLVYYTGQSYPDGTVRRELVASREDYENGWNNNAQTRSDLTDDGTLECRGQRWVPGTDSVSFIGRRWSSLEPDAAVVEGGIYTAPLVFDANGNISGLGALPTLTIPLPLVLVESEDCPVPDVNYYSWAPTADMFVYQKRSDLYGVWVADLNGSESKISSNPGYGPEWSPNGKLIAYSVGGNLVTIKPTGRNELWIVRRTSNWTYVFAQWSPDSSQLVFTGQDSDNNYNWDLFRADANGNNFVQLTDTPTPAREQTASYNSGWR